jgi:4-hydroxybenzoate polyprenyltransferase
MIAEKETQFKKKSKESAGFLQSLLILARSRGEAMFIWSWNTFMACMIAGRGSPPLVPTLLSTVAVVFVALSVYLYNDFTDADLDRLSSLKRSRPLPQETVSQKDVMRTVVLSAAVGLTLALLVNVYSFLWALLYCGLFTVYSFPKIRLKKIFLFKELVIALGIPLTGLVGIYAVADQFVVHAGVAVLIFAVFTYTGQPVLTDSVDIAEDKKAGVHSLATKLSWQKRVSVLIAGTLIVMGVIPVMYSGAGFNAALPVYAVGGGLIFLWVILPLLRKFEESMVLKVKNIAYVYFILLQIFFIIGSLDIHFF